MVLESYSTVRSRELMKSFYCENSPDQQLLPCCCLQLGHKERQMEFSGKLFYMDNKTTKAEERTSVEICKSRVRQVQIVVDTEGKPPRESRSHDRVVLKSLCVGLSFCQLMLYKSDKLLVAWY